MDNFGFEKMQSIQKELQEKYMEQWGGLSPEKGRDTLLWMMIEAGEAADIIKKDGDHSILHDDKVRKHFVEEICDVLLYLIDVMLCYSIKPEELETTYLEKHHKNMERW